MHIRDLVTAFDEALEWDLDDPLLTDPVPSQLAQDSPEAATPCTSSPTSPSHPANMVGSRLFARETVSKSEITEGSSRHMKGFFMGRIT